MAPKICRNRYPKTSVFEPGQNLYLVVLFTKWCTIAKQGIFSTDSGPLVTESRFFEYGDTSIKAVI